MSLALLFHYLLLNMFRMLVHPSAGACDLLWIYLCAEFLWFDVFWCYGVFRQGWCGILMQAEACVHGRTTYQTDLTTFLQPRHIPTQGYNITQSSAPDDGHMVSRNMLSNY